MSFRSIERGFLNWFCLSVTPYISHYLYETVAGQPWKCRCCIVSIPGLPRGKISQTWEESNRPKYFKEQRMILVTETGLSEWLWLTKNSCVSQQNLRLGRVEGHQGGFPTVWNHIKRKRILPRQPETHSRQSERLSLVSPGSIPFHSENYKVKHWQPSQTHGPTGMDKTRVHLLYTSEKKRDIYIYTPPKLNVTKKK